MTPGLFGGLTNLGLEEISEESLTNDSSLNLKAPAWEQQWRPELDVSLAFNPRSILIPVARIEGVTWTMLAPTSADSIIGGQGAAVAADMAQGADKGSLRRRLWLVCLIAFGVFVGMWLERFIIVVVSLHRDFLNSSWGMYYPTKWDWAVFIGTLGMFSAAMFLFVRLLPMISIFEIRTLLPQAEVKHK